LILLALLAFIRAVPATEPPAVDWPGAPAEESLPDYRIGIEDVLKVVVRGEPELSVSLKVRPDGRITVPLVDDINVVGLSSTEVKAEITKRLAEFIPDPKVTVIVDEINSIRVYFLGEIGLQGAINFSKPPRLLQAIATAGGLTEFSKREVILLRQRGGVEKRFVINYKQLVSGDPRQENLLLMPGDTLIFP
jgi:polysaccharide export outer membrane protein